MKNRTVANITQSEHLSMGNTEVKQPLPTMRVEQVDPFLLLHHFGPTTVEPGGDPLDVGPHPHRGFEPVTFLYSGGIRHKDSRGNEGILRGGDVQWMTAGRGIIHSERASREFLEKGGTMEGIQLWVNLPQKDKMDWEVLVNQGVAHETRLRVTMVGSVADGWEHLLFRKR